jgi:YggT family protein
MVWVILYYSLELLKWLIIIRALMSWFVAPGANNPVVDFLRRITDPILRPLADMVPNMGGVDLSPLIAFFAIVLLQRVIVMAA